MAVPSWHRHCDTVAQGVSMAAGLRHSERATTFPRTILKTPNITYGSTGALSRRESRGPGHPKSVSGAGHPHPPTREDAEEVLAVTGSVPSTPGIGTRPGAAGAAATWRPLGGRAGAGAARGLRRSPARLRARAAAPSDGPSATGTMAHCRWQQEQWPIVDGNNLLPRCGRRRMPRATGPR